MIKYADQTGNALRQKPFAKALVCFQSLGTEFSKMRNLTRRLRAAGLNTDLL